MPFQTADKFIVFNVHSMNSLGSQPLYHIVFDLNPFNSQEKSKVC